MYQNFDPNIVAGDKQLTSLNLLNGLTSIIIYAVTNSLDQKPGVIFQTYYGNLFTSLDIAEIVKRMSAMMSVYLNYPAIQFQR